MIFRFFWNRYIFLLILILIRRIVIITGTISVRISMTGPAVDWNIVLLFLFLFIRIQIRRLVSKLFFYSSVWVIIFRIFVLLLHRGEIIHTEVTKPVIVVERIE